MPPIGPWARLLVLRKQCRGACLSLGERCLGAWEAAVFGASHVEDALAVRLSLCASAE